MYLAITQNIKEPVDHRSPLSFRGSRALKRSTLTNPPWSTTIMRSSFLYRSWVSLIITPLIIGWRWPQRRWMSSPRSLRGTERYFSRRMSWRKISLPYYAQAWVLKYRATGKVTAGNSKYLWFLFYRRSQYCLSFKTSSQCLKRQRVW